jgi:hypothetical protein
MPSITGATGLAARIEAAMNNGTYDAYKSMSPLAEFIAIRHFVRANDDRISRLWAEEKRVRRLVPGMEFSPFNKHRVAQMNEYAAALAELRKLAKKAEQRLGRIVINMAPRIDAVTTLEQRLELLNCNPADRVDLTEPNIGLVELISVHCVEDSATHRADEFNIRPLHGAVWAEIIRSMRDTPDGRAASAKFMDEALAPGGLLYGVRTGHLQPDGTLKLQSPALVLHDASGSRVIERYPS